jgi:hypothetical protein
MRGTLTPEEPIKIINNSAIWNNTIVDSGNPLKEIILKILLLLIIIDNKKPASLHV